jgi:hypothetical protein
VAAPAHELIGEPAQDVGEVGSALLANEIVAGLELGSSV